jgi:hypothetical protein
MAIQDPRTARDYLNDARDHYDANRETLTWVAIITVLAVVTYLLFGRGLTIEDAKLRTPTISETSNPAPLIR